MTSIEGNVVDAILKCIRMVSEKQASMSAAQGGAASVDAKAASVEELREMLEDVKIDLCRLASLLVTAPITGRIFLPLPAAYVSAEDAQKSLRAQLGLEGGRFTHS
jgi:hypothetical protein